MLFILFLVVSLAIMSSSTFEVTEPENEGEKDLNFGLEACEENGIGLSAQVDGEVPKDHTYTKDPDGSDEEEKPEDSQEENEETDVLPERRSKRNSKGSKVVKKSNPKNSKAKKDNSPKKEVASSKRTKGKKDVLTEESNKSDDNAKSEKSEEKNENGDQQKTPKRGKKRKVEEKENVIDRSIVEEVQNINEGDLPTLSEEKESESPRKKRNAAKPKKEKVSSPVIEDEDNQNLPKGWTRKVVVRKSGKTAGQVDIYIYSPDGIKFRSRPDIAAYLSRTKSNLKLEDFNFSKKKSSENVAVKASPKKEKASTPVKQKSTPEKKKTSSPSTKKGSKLLVKLSFSPKSKRGRDVKKTPNKVEKRTSSVKKGKASNQKSSKKKKTA